MRAVLCAELPHIDVCFDCLINGPHARFLYVFRVKYSVRRRVLDVPVGFSACLRLHHQSKHCARLSATDPQPILDRCVCLSPFVLPSLDTALFSLSFHVLSSKAGAAPVLQPLSGQCVSFAMATEHILNQLTVILIFGWSFKRPSC